MRLFGSPEQEFIASLVWFLRAQCAKTREVAMATRDELLNEVYEQAVHNEINYFG